jgi:hypothetical protein
MGRKSSLNRGLISPINAFAAGTRGEGEPDWAGRAARDAAAGWRKLGWILGQILGKYPQYHKSRVWHSKIMRLGTAKSL